MIKTNTNLTFMKQTIDIDNWVIEATSQYNDGWTRKHYLDMLIKLKDKLNSIEILNEYNHGKESDKH